MTDGNGGASWLLGMEGFDVLSMTEEECEVFLLVKATADLVGARGAG